MRFPHISSVVLPSLSVRVAVRSLAAMALAVLMAWPGAVPAGAQSSTLVLRNASLIDGVSDAPVRNATVVVRDGSIARIEEGAVEVPAGAVVVDLRGMYLLPGLIDAHVHISDFEAARRALMTGVTTARSAGVGWFADVGLRELARAGRIQSPELLAAGYHVRPSPGATLFIDVPELADLMDGAVRGADAMRRMARAMIEHDVDFIKVTSTERAGLPDTDPRKQLYGVPELEALVQTASEAGIPVQAHAHGDSGARAAVLAGVRSIEHGTYMSDETLGLMVRRGTFLVPTVAVVEDLTIPGGDYDNAVLQIRGRHMLPRVRDMARRAHRLGVRIAAATDTGYGPESTVRLSHELMEYVRIGMTPLEALQSATVVAAELLGVDDHTGRIATGLDADLIVVERNPLEDIGALQDVLLVVNDGELVLDRVELGSGPT